MLPQKVDAKATVSRRLATGRNVFQETVRRLERVYAEGHRIVHSFSGGKDSLCVMECAIIAAKRTNRLPVEIVMRDEELGWPDHYEFCERTADRPEVQFHWIAAGEPHWYAYDRNMPFWWTFDYRLAPEQWLRQPPESTVWVEPITISIINTVDRFPPPEGKHLITTMGLRGGESRRRMMGIYSQGGWLSGGPDDIKWGGWPIYDWAEKDVWTAIKEFGWDYPHAYDQLRRAGVSKRENRMGAFLNPYAARTLPLAQRVFPDFFDRLFARFPGLRYGMAHWQRVTQARHHPSEAWRTTYDRECIRDAPEWIATRSMRVAEATLRRHERHSPHPFPDAGRGKYACFECGAGRGSWEQLTGGMYLGDPFSETTATGLPYVQPEVFRTELAGTKRGRWGGHPG